MPSAQPTAPVVPSATAALPTEPSATATPTVLGDLTATSDRFWVDPFVPRTNLPFTVGLLVTQSGGSQSLEDVTIDFYRDTIYGEFLGRATIPHLAARTTASSLPLTLTLQSPGAFTLVARIDPDNRLVEDNEENNSISRTIFVAPAVTDQLLPIVDAITFVEPPPSDQRELTVAVGAHDPEPGSGVTHLYLNEQAYAETGEGWVSMATSEWLPFSGSHDRYPWRLSPQPGMRYLQARVRDAAGNVSDGTVRRLRNYEAPSDRLVRGQTRTYRYELTAGQSLELNLEVRSGDADLFVWSSDGGQPAFVSNLAGDTHERLLIPAERIVPGIYQVEVYGYSDTEYQLRSAIEQTATHERIQLGGGVDPAKPLPGAPHIALDSVPDPRYGSLPDAAAPIETMRYVYLPLIVGAAE